MYRYCEHASMLTLATASKAWLSILDFAYIKTNT